MKMTKIKEVQKLWLIQKEDILNPEETKEELIGN